ncbi:MAG: hypothetical protein GPJ00_14955 [Microcystis aeruginosa W13-18]|jgi:hypothetical protein|nr:hypothetical protein [Microcystis aeruginosa W13-18]
MGKILHPTPHTPHPAPTPHTPHPAPTKNFLPQTLGQERKSLSVGIGDREGIQALPANT